MGGGNSRDAARGRVPCEHTPGRLHGAIGATPSLLALSACVKKIYMLEYQRFSADLGRSGVVAKRFDLVSRSTCPGEAVCVRLRNLATRKGEAKKWGWTVGEG